MHTYPNFLLVIPSKYFWNLIPSPLNLPNNSFPSIISNKWRKITYHSRVLYLELWILQLSYSGG